MAAAGSAVMAKNGELARLVAVEADLCGFGLFAYAVNFSVFYLSSHTRLHICLFDSKPSQKALRIFFTKQTQAVGRALSEMFETVFDQRLDNDLFDSIKLVCSGTFPVVACPSLVRFLLLPSHFFHFFIFLCI